MNRFTRNSIAFIGSLTIFTLIVRSQLPDPREPAVYPDPMIVMSGEITAETTYRVKVEYWSTSESYFCTSFNFGSLIPFGFGGSGARHHKQKTFTHYASINFDRHYIKIPLDSISGPCGWKPIYLDLCLIKNNVDRSQCIKLLKHDHDGGSLRRSLPLAQGKVINLECEAPRWHVANHLYYYKQCYRGPIEYKPNFNVHDYSLNYNYSLVPQEIKLNIDILSPEQAEKRRIFIRDAHTKSHGPNSWP